MGTRMNNRMMVVMLVQMAMQRDKVSIMMNYETESVVVFAVLISVNKTVVMLDGGH
jgi:hypothetical protein